MRDTLSDERSAEKEEAGLSEEEGSRSSTLRSAQDKSVKPAYEGNFVLEGEFSLASGQVLVSPTLHYAIYGHVGVARERVVLVCHALSGSALAGEWWPGLFCTDSADGIVDLARQCVICVNLLGSCYGSTGPGSIDPASGSAYGPDFPLISIRDNVRAQARLLDSLGMETIELAIGGSIGGMQALEWTILYPDRVKRAVIIAVAPLGAMGLALNHLQRQAIVDDPDWRQGRYSTDSDSTGRQPRRGLSLARKIAMLSYKSVALFDERFGREPNRNGEDPWVDAKDQAGTESGLTGGRFDVAGFLDYQGERFLERFDANSYLAILRTMDLWDPAKGYASTNEAFGRITAELTLIGISSDWLFPEGDVRRLADDLRAAGVRGEYHEMITDHGHDAFLAEQAALVRLVRPAVRTGFEPPAKS